MAAAACENLQQRKSERLLASEKMREELFNEIFHNAAYSAEILEKTADNRNAVNQIAGSKTMM